MLSKESKKFIEEFYNDERYQTFVEELKGEDEIMGQKFEGVMDKVSQLCEGNMEKDYEEEGDMVSEDDKTQGEKTSMMDKKKGPDGLAIYIGGIAKKKGY